MKNALTKKLVRRGTTTLNTHRPENFICKLTGAGYTGFACGVLPQRSVEAPSQ